MNKTIQGFRTLLITLLFIVGSQAQALVLTPDDADWVDNSFPPSALDGDDVAAIVGTASALDLYYKSDVGGSDSGSFAGSYDTSYSGDPNNALIEYLLGNPSIMCPECYLVVKNGNQPQYLFDLGAWDGIEDLDLQDFYPDQGAISHVAIWGAVAHVPESGALVLMGLGLIGLGFARRRRTS